eukprot:Hpha_TRINITY_DN15844_c1_g11::TRINITY_DN15844_c1_g11_i1::g.187237::m.187237
MSHVHMSRPGEDEMGRDVMKSARDIASKQEEKSEQQHTGINGPERKGMQTCEEGGVIFEKLPPAPPPLPEPAPPGKQNRSAHRPAERTGICVFFGVEGLRSRGREEDRRTVHSQ